MIVKAIKRKVYSDGSFVLLLRAEDVPEELEDKKVSLARNGDHCFYALNDFESHDDHVPLWNPNGRAPKNSSAPKMTASKSTLTTTGRSRSKPQSPWPG